MIQKVELLKPQSFKLWRLPESHRLSFYAQIQYFLLHYASTLRHSVHVLTLSTNLEISNCFNYRGKWGKG